MTHQINWGSVADWVAAFGSIFASITALYLARSGSRIRLSLEFGPRVSFHPTYGKLNVISFLAINIGNRPTIVTSIGFSVGRFRKRYAIINIVQSRTSQAIPLGLTDGERGHWTIELNEAESWYTDLCKDFVKNERDINTLKALFYTSNGGRFDAPAEESLKEKLRTHLAMRNG